MSAPSGAVLLALALTAAGSVTTARASQSKPRIDALEASRDGDRVTVSFRVDRAIDDDTLEEIRSGMTVQQRHKIEVVARRAVPLWPAKVLAKMRIDTAAVYDTLTQRFDLTRTTRVWPGADDRWTVVAEERHSTSSPDEVRGWMSGFESLPPLPLPLSSEGVRLKLRVESTLGRHFWLYLFPARITVSAERRLEP